MKPILECVHPVLMSRDVNRSIEFYQALGFALLWRDSDTDSRYALVRRDHVELHFQWHDAREWDFPNDRPTYRFVVNDPDPLHNEFRERARVLDMKEVEDTPWGTREFHVRDPDMNGLQFYRVLAATTSESIEL